MLTRRIATAAQTAALRPTSIATPRPVCAASLQHIKLPGISTQRRAASWLLQRHSQAPASSPRRATLKHSQLLRHLSTEVRAAIDKAVDTAPVVLFMKGTPETPQCGFSRATVQILGLQGVDPAKFVAFNVLEDQALREGIKEYSEWPTIPQLYINKEFVGGCDILMQMHQDGSLGKLLEKEGVILLADGEAEGLGEK